MKPPRELTADEKALKTTTHALIEACGGSLACASVLGLSHSLVSAYGLQSEPKRFMPAQCILKLERACGQPIVSRWLTAAAAGDRASPARELVIEDIARICVESSEAKLAIVQAVADNKVDAGDRDAVRRELRDLIRTAHEILALVEQP